MNEQVTEAQLFEMLGRLYASREMLRLELAIAERTIAVLNDPEFIKGGSIGLEQERRGEGIPLADAKQPKKRAN